MLKWCRKFSDRNALKLTCGDTEIEKIPGEKPPDPRSPWEATSNVAGKGASNAGGRREGGRGENEGAREREG